MESSVSDPVNITSSDVCYSLTVYSVGEAPRTIYLTGGEYIIGRADDCRLLINSPFISRRHCMLHVTSSEVLISDLNSANGTYVNNRRITMAPVSLKLNDNIQIGPASLVLTAA